MKRITYVPSEAQQKARDWIMERRRAALFMGCGLGKTAVILHALKELLYDGALRGALIVAPKRVCELTWPAEHRKWSGMGVMRIADLRTPEGMAALRKKQAEIYLINYDRLQQLSRDYFFGFRGKAAFDVVVWDELTKAKKHDSKRIKAIQPHVEKHCIRHWGMTGTPAASGLDALYGQMKLLDGGRSTKEGGVFGRSYHNFIDVYFDKNPYTRAIRARADTRDRIFERLKDFALVLKSSDYLDIPDVAEVDVEITLPETARVQYEELEEELLLLLQENKYVMVPNAGVLTSKLLQVTGGAVYYDEKSSWEPLHDGKIQALKKLLKDIGNRPVLLMYQFKHELTRLMEALPGAVSFKGSKDDKALVADWNAGKIKYLLANPRSMAHGLNMQQGGNVVVWFTLTWSREDYEQTFRRLARRGQEKSVEIYRLITRNSMDEVAAEVLRRREKEDVALQDALRDWQRSKTSLKKILVK